MRAWYARKTHIDFCSNNCGRLPCDDLAGDSLAFTNGGPLSFVGGSSKAFLNGVSADSVSPTFSNSVYIPEQLTFVFR